MLAVPAWHKIGPPAPGGWESWYYVPSSTFERQLAELERGGWQVIDVPALLRALDGSEPLPRKSALLTFDDGYRSLLNAAVPVLRQFGYSAVVFVPTAFIGRNNEFDEGIEPVESICNADDLQALAAARVSVQSHGVSHRPFSALSHEEQVQELRSSKGVLETIVGEPVDLFSFPYGDAGAADQTLKAGLREVGYRAAFLYSGGLNVWPLAERFLVRRLAMGPETDLNEELRRLEFASAADLRRG